MDTKHAYRWMNRKRLGLVIILILAIGSSAWIGHAIAADANLAPSQQDLKLAEQAGEHLGKLSDSFRAVARVVEPSVVFISVKAQVDQPRSPTLRREFRFGPGDDPRDLFRWFFEDDPWGFHSPHWRFDPDGPQRSPDRREPREQRRYDPPRQIGAGSGWVWDDDGHIITNHHVIDRADQIEVVFSDGSIAEAEVVGSDPKTDVAVIKVKRDGLYPARRADKPVDQGDIVFAFGSPFQYRFSMSQGIVSGTERAVGILGPEGYENFIQTDAAINPGNSGGPLTNVRGEVVGMNTAIATRSGAFNGIGFAVPVDVIGPVVEQLIDDGEVTRGYIGAYIGDDPKLLESFGVKEGVVIHDITKDGPADEAGLEPGDVVTHIDGKAVDSSRELRRIVASIKPGEKATFRIIRDGDRREVVINIGRQTEELASMRPGEAGDAGPGDGRAILSKLGIEDVRTFEREHAQQQDWTYQPGVLVVDVRAGSVAQMAGLRPGMVITHVIGQRVESAADLYKELADHDPGKGIRFRVRVDDRRSTFVVMRILEPR
ncbi:MAG: trypsin-like peptidase domain-containing protein [Planctomycetota bacterium]